MNQIKLAIMSVALVAGLAMCLVPSVASANNTTKTNTGGGAGGKGLSGLSGGMNAAKSDDHIQSIDGDGGVFKKVVNVMLYIIGAVSVVVIVYAGIQYTLSSGDPGKVTSAKNTILYAVVGLIVAILAYALVNFVLTSMGGESESTTSALYLN